MAKEGNKRVTGKEQFYTPSNTAFSIIENTVQTFGKSILDHPFLEPAGGTGAFINAAYGHGFTKIISYDIEPKHPMVLKADFLNTTLDVKNVITVSNPPFGRNNSLSVKFFNHAAKNSHCITFIVPRSWRKWSVINKLDPTFRLIRDDDLTINYVDDQGTDNYSGNNLKTCVQYWVRTNVNRSPIDVVNMNIVEKVSYEDADVALTIFGYGCGNVDTNFERKPNTTKMFLRLNHSRALEALNNITYKQFSERTAYTQALSFKEINYLLNEYIFGFPMISGDHFERMD
jgi:predicted RNA methylase